MNHQRQRKTKDPCADCFLHRERCICDQLPFLDLKTRVCLVIHSKELKRTTNTGRLALKILKNSEMKVRGDNAEPPLDLSCILSKNYRTVLFYPSDAAQELTPEFADESELPLQLIVPDGNWRQASKVHYRHHEIQHIPRVKITSAPESQEFLRLESKDSGMATLQAIAYALGAIEGLDVQHKVLDVYNLKLKRTLQGRGVLSKD